MNTTDFDDLCDLLSIGRRTIVLAKRPEYTEGHSDVLNNFKVVANELGLTPVQVWYVYFRKHIASIGQYAKDPTVPTSEPIDGRIMDAMNYLELLFALVNEDQE